MACNNIQTLPLAVLALAFANTIAHTNSSSAYLPDFTNPELSVCAQYENMAEIPLRRMLLEECYRVEAEAKLDAEQRWPRVSRAIQQECLEKAWDQERYRGSFNMIRACLDKLAPRSEAIFVLKDSGYLEILRSREDCETRRLARGRGRCVQQ
jgi:hypothetical protein